MCVFAYIYIYIIYIHLFNYSTRCKIIIRRRSKWEERCPSFIITTSSFCMLYCSCVSFIRPMYLVVHPKNFTTFALIGTFSIKSIEKMLMKYYACNYRCLLLLSMIIQHVYRDILLLITVTIPYFAINSKLCAKTYILKDKNFTCT